MISLDCTKAKKTSNYELGVFCFIDKKSFTATLLIIIIGRILWEQLKPLKN